MTRQLQPCQKQKDQVRLADRQVSVYWTRIATTQNPECAASTETEAGNRAQTTISWLVEANQQTHQRAIGVLKYTYFG
jgi:hypothetical protein